MKVYYAIEIQEDTTDHPKRYSVSGLYPSREAAVAAFLDLDTMELYRAVAAYQHSQDGNDPSDVHDESVDKLAAEFHAEQPDAVEAVQKFERMVRDNDDAVFGQDYLTYRFGTYTVHEA
jgi:hypothetical protein